jgi:hypothetical protein
MILVDAHVHIYSNYRIDKFFEAAFKNFRRVSKNYGDSKKNVGILCLAEGKNESFFQDLQEFAGGKGFIDRSILLKKSIKRTKENISLRVTSGQEDNIILIAGRQTVSQENIEVLALGSLKIFSEGHSIGKLIADIVAMGAIPVIPWGFGKWFAKRGKILKDIFENDEISRIFVGDNGNRPNFYPKPSLINLAEKMKIKNIPGSDPLPFADEYRRPGSYGFSIKGSLNFLEPWKYLKKKLLDPDTTFEYFGELESPLRFLRNQLKMQWLKLF